MAIGHWIIERILLYFFKEGKLRQPRKLLVPSVQTPYSRIQTLACEVENFTIKNATIVNHSPNDDMAGHVPGR